MQKSLQVHQKKRYNYCLHKFIFKKNQHIINNVYSIKRFHVGFHGNCCVCECYDDLLSFTDRYRGTYGSIAVLLKGSARLEALDDGDREVYT